MDSPDGAPLVETVDFASDEPIRNPTQIIRYYMDASRSVGIDDIGAYQTQFAAIDRHELEFGYVADAIWLRIPINNSSAETKTRYLLLETNWMESMRVWLARSQSTELILDENKNKPFSARELPHRNLVTRVALAPGQSGTLWLRYTSPGTTALPISFETELSFVQRTQSRASKSLVFYALMVLFIVVAALSYLPFRYGIFPVYVCYAATVLVYVMQRDGFAFQYLWPSLPYLNSIASLPLGTMLAFFAILFSRHYLTTAMSYPLVDKLLQACMVVSLLFIPYGLLYDEQSAKEWATLWVFFVAAMLLALGVRSWLDRGNRLLFFVAGWLGVVSASLTMVLGGFFGFEIGRETTLDAIRLAMVFDAVMMGFAMAERILHVRRQRDAALERQVSVLQTNLDLHDRVNKLEARYAHALDLAKSSDKILADATHDIRQPLFALRTSLKSMSAETGGEHVASAARSLVYLEQLVDEYLARALDEDTASASVDTGTPISVVLTAITDMFAEDAKARGLAFRVRPSSAIIRANAMTITRIVSNFVANAVRYTKSGGVVVGVRRRRGLPYIVVYDTGPGLSPAELAAARQRTVRGVDNDEDGKGLGLDIALSLARDNGLPTLMASAVGRGSAFGVALEARLEQSDPDEKDAAGHHPAPRED